MEPESILERVKQAYLDVSTYADQGVVNTSISHDASSLIEFKTFVAKPDKVRFEWQNSIDAGFVSRQPTKSVICSDGINNHAVLFSGVSEANDLTQLFARATGVTNGAVNQITHLLLPGIVKLSRFWIEMEEPRLLKDEMIEDVRCYHLVGTKIRPDDIDVWIRKDDYTVRRLGERAEITLGDTDTALDMAIHYAEQNKMPKDVMDMMIESYKALPKFSVRVYHSQFDYKKVAINEEISAAHFTELEIG